jgi:hypothetical protein
MGRAEDWELTANHYIALPMISRANGALTCANVLHRGALGMIEWAADRDLEGTNALLTPQLRVDGVDTPLRDLTWERLERWVPRYRLETPQLRLTATICAPPGYDASHRGCMYLFELEHQGAGERTVEVSLQGDWRWSLQTIGSRRPLVAQRRLARSDSRPGLALEVSGAYSAALGVAVYGSQSYHRAASAESDFSELAAGAQLEGAAGEALRFEIGRTVRIAPGRRAVIAFFLGLGAERDGALATAQALRRLGAEVLLKETRLELSKITRKVRDPALGAILNRNLLFSYFFSTGRALDDERLYPVTSRSPLHPRCATFNEREALLWALPAMLIADANLARELLLRCFEQHSYRPGEGFRYLDGGVLVPGVVLHQWCAYAIALDRYILATGDRTILDEPLVGEVLRELEMGFYPRLHHEVFLGSTDLSPSGDAPDHPFVTFDNALLHNFCRIMEGLHASESEERKRFSVAAEEVAAAIWRKCVVDVDGEPLLAWSTDLGEAASVYDDPAGSLQWLPHYGFCEPSEPLWRNTMEFLRSSRYKLWLGDRRFPGLAARSTPTLASTAGLCADLLGAHANDRLATLKQLQFAGGVAATHYDPDTGVAAGSRHDGALAGLLAWTLQSAMHT